MPKRNNIIRRDDVVSTSSADKSSQVQVGKVLVPEKTVKQKPLPAELDFLLKAEKAGTSYRLEKHSPKWKIGISWKVVLIAGHPIPLPKIIFGYDGGKLIAEPTERP